MKILYSRNWVTTRNRWFINSVIFPSSFAAISISIHSSSSTKSSCFGKSRDSSGVDSTVEAVIELWFNYFFYLKHEIL